MASTLIRLQRPDWFIDDKELVDTYGPIIGVIAVGIYLVLRRYADRQTGECWPCHRTIARHLDIDVSTVKRHLPRLENAGLVTIEARQTERGDQTSNRYTLHDPTSPVVAPVLVPTPQGCVPPPPGQRALPRKTCQRTEPYEPQPIEQRQPPAGAEGQGRERPKPPEPSERPDDLLQRFNLEAETRARLAAEALEALVARGEKPFTLIQPVIDAMVVTLWEQHHSGTDEGASTSAAPHSHREGLAHAACAA